MDLIKLSLNCIMSTIIYSYLRFFYWFVTKTACQVGRSRKIFRTCKCTVRPFLRPPTVNTFASSLGKFHMGLEEKWLRNM